MRKLFIFFSVCWFSTIQSAPLSIPGFGEVSESLIILNTEKSPKQERCRALNLQSGEHNLIGVLHLPTTPMPKAGYPTVIIFHGFRGHKSGSYTGGYRSLARALAYRGIAVVRFDCAGCGDSEGLATEVPIRTYVQNGTDILKAVINYPEVDASRIGIAGFSLGCHTAFHLATLYNPKSFSIRAISVWAPVADGVMLFKEMYQIVSQDTSLVPSLGKETYFGSPPLVICPEDPYDFMSVQDYILMNSMPKQIPVLHLQGLEDSLVTLSHQQLYQACAASNVTFKSYMDTGHSFGGSPYVQTIIEDIVDHFSRNL